MPKVRGFRGYRNCTETVSPNATRKGCFRVSGFGLRFRGSGSGFKVQGSRFRVQGSGFRVSGLEFRV